MNLMLFRIAVIAVALAIWFWTQRLIAGKSETKDGIGDAVHRLTAGWHRYFSEHEKAANRALIVSSLFIDLLGLSLIGLAIFGSSFAPFLAILIVFSLRQVCQICCTLPPPPGMIWRDPGFPSLLVTYGVSNDLFFSGHTALAVLGAIEICHLAPWSLGTVVVFIALGEVMIVLVLRAHYTLDVIAGAFAAWFAADVAKHIAPFVDGWLESVWR
ncbi:MAG: phosphatase PAP2-related protein [Verrucomicrobiales bacterium]